MDSYHYLFAPKRSIHIHVLCSAFEMMRILHFYYRGSYGSGEDLLGKGSGMIRKEPSFKKVACRNVISLAFVLSNTLAAGDTLADNP